MTNSMDVAELSAPQLVALKAKIDERLEEIRQRHIQEAATLGLTLVEAEGSPKRRRRAKRAEQETD